MNLKLRKINENLPEFQKHGNWYDVTFHRIIQVKDGKEIEILPIADKKSGSKHFRIEKGNHYLFRLGFATKIPEGFEAHLLPRSSTFKNYGLLMANSMGIIDDNYSGNNDEWMASYYSTRDVKVFIGERIAQFTVVKSSEEIEFALVTELDSKDRGGFGSSGK